MDLKCVVSGTGRLGRDSQEIENVLLIRSGKRQLVEFGIELGDANAVATECAKVRQDVAKALHWIIVRGAASGIFVPS